MKLKNWSDIDPINDSYFIQGFDSIHVTMTTAATQRIWIKQQDGSKCMLADLGPDGCIKSLAVYNIKSVIKELVDDN
jgi:hypothetical protein